MVTKEIKEEEHIIDSKNLKQMSKLEIKKLLGELEAQMREAARKLDFEQAMALRDIIFEIRADLR